MNPSGALVVHESMFGNTSAIAEIVADTLRHRGLAVVHTDVRETLIGAVWEHDLVVLGAPTHAFSLSRPSTRADAVRQGAVGGTGDIGLREWILALPDVRREDDRQPPPFAVFDTRVGKVRRLPAAGHQAARMLRHKGYRLLSRPVGFCVADTKGPIAPGEFAHAAAWGNTLADELVTAKS
jgi:hypothetical protein